VKGERGVRSHFVLPLPAFVQHPLTALFLGAVHVYLAAGHLGELAANNLEWTHLWKGFGALAGAYVFAALASRGLARHEGLQIVRETLEKDGVISPPTGN
jgi:hypothetical protein